ncbi:hypothetical protein [Zhihengliuella sp.]|uniref:hypothetical protein n=1 Tax=Zhihengliuella sp. TaxID=1954483 RepID=UPI0028113C8E|nr:hypothetical protein [Zhihengliuella sp.]
MSDHVPAHEIESIVRMPRSPEAHFARAVSAEQRVYILHSRECLATHADLRDCPHSLALDQGIDPEAWPEDVPVRVAVVDGRLAPHTIHRGPDCLVDKHRACDGRAFDPDADDVVPCDCSCHAAEAAPAEEAA